MHGVRETEQRNGEKTTQKKKNRRVSSNFTPLTEKEEKSLQSKKLNYCDLWCTCGVCVTSNSYTTHYSRERERDDDDEKNV
jgi:hypothetical protein